MHDNLNLPLTRGGATGGGVLLYYIGINNGTKYPTTD